MAEVLPKLISYLHLMRYTSLQYFYHPDHLGSASWITDADGNGYQHLQYLPPDSYRDGERWVEQRLGTYNSPYQFSGKEKDEETGYNYFGARYYDSGLSIWLSVDPMAEKYVSLSPFQFCANSPYKYVDTDGQKFAEPRSMQTKRFKRNLRQSKEGRSVLKEIRRSRNLIYIHYVSDYSEGNDAKLFKYSRASYVITGGKYNDIISGSYSEDRHVYYMFNESNGYWDANDNIRHIVINEESDIDLLYILGKNSSDPIEQRLIFHNTAVHEGIHAIQTNSHWTISQQNRDGKYYDTGISVPYIYRDHEIDADNHGQNAENQLRIKIQCKEEQE
jgi:RHS repeat-associated protein